MPKVDLFFETFHDKEIEEKTANYNVIRLKVIVQFKSEQGWTKPYSGIIDTGAHTTLIPLSIWKKLVVENVSGNYKMFGISKKDECAIRVKLGKIKCILVDENGNHTQELYISAYLAETDNVPLIIGFNNLLDKFKTVFDYKNNIAYMEY